MKPFTITFDPQDAGLIRCLPKILITKFRLFIRSIFEKEIKEIEQTLLINADQMLRIRIYDVMNNDPGTYLKKYEEFKRDEDNLIKAVNSSAILSGKVKLKKPIEEIVIDDDGFFAPVHDPVHSSDDDSQLGHISSRDERKRDAFKLLQQQVLVLVPQYKREEAKKYFSNYEKRYV